MRGFIQKTGLAILLTIFLAFSAFAFDARVSPEAKTFLNDESASAYGYSGPFTFPFELDEQVGDTFSVGYTWRDMQHNGTIGRMIGVGFDPANPDSMIVHFIWTGREGPEENSLTMYNKVSFNENNEPYIPHQYPNGTRIDGGGDNGFGAYTVLYTYGDENLPMVAYHGQTSATSDYLTYITVETSFMQFFFNPKYPVLNQAGVFGEWPHMAITEYEGTKYQHVVMQPDSESDYGENVYYVRSAYDGATFSDASPGGGTQLVTDRSMALSSNVVASNDGNLVTIGATYSRWLERGQIPSSWDGLALSQSDNDVYLWTSDDGGATWDWDSPFNLTNFAAPNSDYLPDDTTSANQDTFRAYTEVDMIYDDDDVLHCMFNIHQFDHFRESVYRSGRIYYWNDADSTFSMVADGFFWNYAIERAWEKFACHGSVEKDSDGVLWALWQQYGEEGDTLIQNDTIYSLDVSDDGYANTDLYMSMSLDNGKRWMKGVNITNTRLMEWDLQPGQSRSEIEPSMAPYVDGDYIHITYTLDFDPGISVPAGTDAEGEPTRNQQIYQRIAKQELIDLFAANAEYQENYPLTLDTERSYVDPDDWEWDDPFSSFVGGEDNNLTPDQFELKQNYPNPFNPSTQIAFNLKKQGNVTLAVFDVLGREVATLVNRTMDAGNHKVTFLADELPSGVYFYKLTSGDASQVRKMVLMK